MKSQAATSDSHFTCHCTDMAGAAWGIAVIVNQALGARLMFTSHGEDQTGVSGRNDVSIAH